MKITSSMWAVLEVIERHGRVGRSADPDFYPTRTMLAVIRRGLVERMADGSVRLTDRGRASLARLNAPFATHSEDS